MTAKFRSLRQRLLIGASLGSLVLGGSVWATTPYGARTTTDANAVAAKAAQSAAQRNSAAMAAAERSRQALEAATRARQQARSVQAAARNVAAAANANLVNGLVAGGLERVTDAQIAQSSSLWTGAGKPVETQGEDGRTKVTIEQNQEKAILTWNSFTVGQNTDLTFDHKGNTDYITLNRVIGNAQSQVFGSITADGSVYIINQNGILFGGASTVNVRSLIASGLDIGNDKFLGSLITTAWDETGPTFRAGDGVIAQGIKVEAGALITAKGGQIVLLGGDVSNSGTLSANDGQVLLAAGQQAYLKASDDTAMRGWFVQLGTGGEAYNNGIIEADRGNITLAGRNVALGSQDGAASVLQSSTSLITNGSIILQASDQAQKNIDVGGSASIFLGWVPYRTGTVSIDPNSVLQILPELDDTQTSATDALLAASYIEIYGSQVQIGKNAVLQALSGRIDIEVLDNPNPEIMKTADKSLIHIDEGAILDVSGARGVQLDVARNFVEVELRGAELADTPLVYDALYGKKVWVDIRDVGTFDDPLMADVEWIEGSPGQWVGSSLFNATGYIGMIQRGVGELSTHGGSISLTGRGDIIAQQGSVLNVSGGTIDYTSNWTPVTYGVSGRYYLPFSQIEYGTVINGVSEDFAVNHTRWGVVETWKNPLARQTRWEAGYTEGRPAGTINLTATRVVFEGELYAAQEAGERQIRLGEEIKGGSLILGDSTATPSQAEPRQYWLDRLVIQNEPVNVLSGYVPGQTLSPDVVSALSTRTLDTSGIGSLEIYANSEIVLTEGTTLALTANGLVRLYARAVEIDGSIRTAGGDIDLKAMRTTAATGSVGQRVRIGETAVLDVSGNWINGWRYGETPGETPLAVDGGSITALVEDLAATDVSLREGPEVSRPTTGTIVVENGAVLDVSGGAYVNFDGKLEKIGDAGAIVLGGFDVEIGEEAELRGYALSTPTQAGKGGSLTLIGFDSLVISDNVTDLESFAGGILETGVLEAGSPAPLTLKLAEPYTYEAGERLTFDTTYRITRLTSDDVLAAVTNTSVSSSARLTLADGWTVPAGTTVRLVSGPSVTSGTYGTSAMASTAANPIVLQPGDVLQALSNLPVGFSPSVSVFPTGIPLLAAGTTALLAAGEPLKTPYTLPAGTTVTAGTTFNTAVKVARPEQHLTTDFFQEGGFASYALTAKGDVFVLPGTQIVPAPQYRQIGEGFTQKASGSDLSGLGTLAALPDVVHVPNALTLQSGLQTSYPQGSGSALGEATGSVWLGEGSLIDVGAGGSVRLTAQDRLEIEGTIKAHGGSITARIAGPDNATFTGDIPAQQVFRRQNRVLWLADTARLEAQAALLPTWNAYGLNTGEWLAGGVVSLQVSASGYIVTEAGSLIDVSGGVATLDIARPTAGSSSAKLLDAYAPATVWSDAGTVRISVNDGAWLEGGYKAGVAHENANAGRFELDFASSYLQYYDDGISTRRLILHDQGSQLPAGLRPGDLLGPKVKPDDITTNISLRLIPTREALLDVSTLNEGGFGGIELSARLTDFRGDISLQAGESLVLNTGRLNAVTSVASVVRLDAPYVRLGSDSWLSNQNLTSIGTPVTGPGTLAVFADYIEFGGRTVLGGFGTGEFHSTGDIVFDGISQPIARNSTTWGRAGTLLAEGTLIFDAEQLYPAAGALFSVEVSGDDSRIVILPGDETAVTPLSVAGKLTLAAQTITHQGVLRAPLGQITFQAGDSGTVTLAAGSVTDVSLHGLTLPYGTLLNGDWYQGFGEAYVQASTGLLVPASTIPEKRISLSGGTLDIQEGATVDLSGGGDLLGAEFTPGTGGSRDLLERANVYAVLPGAQSLTAPSSTGTTKVDQRIGTQIWLEGVPGLEAGWYTLLPSAYALLPGGHAVVFNGSTNDLTTGVTARPDGGYSVSTSLRSGLTGTQDRFSSDVLVLPADTVHQYSEYKLSYANAYFAKAAEDAGNARPALGIDAGQLTLAASSDLKLNGDFRLAAAEGGRGGLVDIASESIAVIADGAAAVEGYALNIEANVLSGIGAQSLLLGGSRALSVDGYVLSPLSSRILVANDAASALEAPEVLLLAGAGVGDIRVSEGAVIRATGTYSGEALPFVIGTQAPEGEPGTGSGQGAFLALSNAATDLLVTRYDIDGAPGTSLTGTIDVAGGTRLTSEGSLLFDATRNSVIDADAEISARSIELASSTVSFGEAPEGTTGFIANPHTLAALAQSERLVLRSYSALDFYEGGNFNLLDPATGLPQVKELVLDAGALRQAGTGAIAIAARNLTLRNTAGRLPAAAAEAGQLTLSAERLTLGSGESAFTGFTQARIEAGETLFDGTGALSASSGLTFSTPFVTATAASEYSVSSGGLLRFETGTLATPEDSGASTGIGAVIALSGQTVDVATRILLPSGTLTLEALGDLTVGAGAELNLAGREQSFFDEVRVLPAGDVTLISQTGDIYVGAGAVINLEDPDGGGDLTVTVPEGSFTIDGKATGASFTLDAGSLPGFGAMQAVLNDGGFAASRKVRLRSGDALIDGYTKTRKFELTVDEGGITVTGTIDASGATGGSIRLNAADDVVLQSGAVLTVKGEDFDGSGKGGSVYLSAGTYRIVDGQDVTRYDAVVDIQSGSLIDLGVANAQAAAQVVSLNEAGSRIAVFSPSTLTFPNGTPEGTTLVASVAVIVTRADGSTYTVAAGAPITLEAGATVSLSGQGEVSVASGGQVAVLLPTSGRFETDGVTTLTTVPFMLDSAGSSIHLNGGAPVVLPNGTPGNDIITTDSNSVTVTTVSNGSLVTAKAGESTLELSAGSAFTLNSSTGQWESTVDRVKLSGSGVITQSVTLTRSGTSGLTGPGAIYFTDGLPETSRLVFDSTANTLQGVTIPAGGSLTVELTPYSSVGTGDWRALRHENGGSLANIELYFPEGTPEGTLIATGGFYYGSQYIVSIPGQAPYQATRGDQIALPPGSSLRFPSGNGSDFALVQGATGTLKFEIRNLGTTSFTSGQVYGYNLVVSNGSAGSGVKPYDSVSYSREIRSYFVGAEPLKLSLISDGTQEVRGAILHNPSAGLTLSFPDGGSFIPTGTADLGLSLNGGGRFNLEKVALSTFSSGAVLSLNNGGTLRFVSGNNPIPMILSAQAQLTALNGASALDLGGGQAGTLHLRAPQIANSSGASYSEIGIRPIAGNVIGAARIIAEGYRIYDLGDSAGLSGGTGIINTAVRNAVVADGNAYASHNAAIEGRLLSANPALASVLEVTSGVELINANDAPATVDTVLNSGGSVNLGGGNSVSFVNGLSNGTLTVSGVSNTTFYDVRSDTDGVSVVFNGSVNYQSLSVTAGTSILFPEGTGTKQIQGSGTLYLPDGSTKTLQGYNTPTTVPEGGIFIPSANSELVVYGSGTPVRVVLPAGAYTLNTRDFSITALPAGAAIVGTDFDVRLGWNGTQALQVKTPNTGQGSSDITLATAWDLSSVRFGADLTPGILTLRAAGNVVINANLSDGFVNGNWLLDDESWSYRFAGGADFSGANLLGVQPEFQVDEGHGNVIFRPVTTSTLTVRTGTGNIEIAASHDIRTDRVRYGSNTSSGGSAIVSSTIYTAGRPAHIQAAPDASFNSLADGRRAYGGRFALAYGGGYIDLTAQRDIIGPTRGSIGNQPNDWRTLLPEQWLTAQGRYNEVSGIYSNLVAWGSAYTRHTEGISTLGGGNLSVEAGRDIVALTASISDTAIYQGATPAARDLLSLGGGDLKVISGRDANALVLYAASGQASVDVGRNLGTAVSYGYSTQSYSVSTTTMGSKFAIGSASLDINVRGNIVLSDVYNPMLLNNGATTTATQPIAHFSTYDENSALKLTSLIGDISLYSSPVESWYAYAVPNAPALAFIRKLIPGNLEAVSYSGDISVSDVILTPLANGDLTLLAQDSVSLSSVVVSDADPAIFTIPYAHTNASSSKNDSLMALATALSELLPDTWPSFDRSQVHAASLYRASDANPVRVYAVEGDVTGAAGSTMYLANVSTALVTSKPAEIRAGRDIARLELVGQHFNDTQTTLLWAGRDIVLDWGSNLKGLDRPPSSAGVWIGGPGSVELIAGRNIDLGTGFGVQTVGNRLNPWLSEGVSADIFLGVGFGASGPDYAGFAKAYIDPASTFATHHYTDDLRDSDGKLIVEGLVSYMRDRTGDDTLDAQGAWQAFQTLNEAERNRYIRQVFYGELKRAGTDGVSSGDYNDGYFALARFFPTDPELFPNDRALTDEEQKAFTARWDGYRELLPEYYSGELSLRYSQIRSLYDGSIEVLVPGGAIDGGLSRPGPDIIQTGKSQIGQGIGYVRVERDILKSASDLGIVALRKGDVNILSYGNVIVNQSRIFAIGGGDMLIWSSYGDINAGKGAKTAVLAPPPRLVFDPASGGFSLELTGAATGSGIATLITETGQEPGSVYLFAPFGTIDAGDAGIRVSGNLVIGAVEIRGADNIAVEGDITGIPQAQAVNTNALTAASAVAAVAINDAAELSERARSRPIAEAPVILTVRFLGFGPAEE